MMMRTRAAAAKGVFQGELRMRAKNPPDCARARPRRKKMNFFGGAVTRGEQAEADDCGGNEGREGHEGEP